MKNCTKCKTDKPISEFYKNNRMSDGLQTRCKPCMKAVNAEWYTRNHTAVRQRVTKNRHEAHRRFNEYKSTLSCSRCTENDQICLDFHHPDPTQKEFSISERVGNTSWKKLKLEIDKCIIVCSNCHRKLHRDELL